MRNQIDSIMGQKVFECEFKDRIGELNLSDLEAEGICFRFSQFMKKLGISDEEPIDVYNNTSELRKGNAIDVYDNYVLEGMIEISSLYVTEDSLRAVLYNAEDDSYYGEIEIPKI